MNRTQSKRWRASRGATGQPMLRRISSRAIGDILVSPAPSSIICKRGRSFSCGSPAPSVSCPPTFNRHHPTMDTTNEVEILLIEDNPRDAEMTMRELKKRNLTNKLVWVKDGAAALEFIFGTGRPDGRGLNHRPKVILLDLKLPKVDGLEVLRRLKSDAQARLIPAAVVTSSREESDIVRSYDLGVNSYIVKPVDFDKFSEAVAQLGMYWLLLNQPPEPSPATPPSSPEPGE